jgi:fatty acid desaturase
VDHPHIGGPHPRASAAGRVLSQAFWALIAGVVVAYVFFLALGAFGSSEADVVTAIVVVLALLWVGHAFYVARHSTREQQLAREHERERRGF